MEPEPTAESLLKGPHQELNAYIEHLLYLLREKDLILLNKNVEIESLKTLLSFYRDQFDLDSYSQTLKELEGFLNTFLLIIYFLKNRHKIST